MSNNRNRDGVSCNSVCSFYTKIQGFRLKDLLVEWLCDFCYLPPSESPITINTTAESTCPGCKRVFTYRSLSQHIATTNHIHCHVVHAASLPQSLGGPPPHEQALLTLTPNSTSQNHPDLFFGRERPSGHDGTPYDLPDLLLLGLESIMTENMGDSKFALH